MTHTGVRSRAAGIFAGAGALSLLLGATALLVAPSANADQTGGHNPPGNNSTIKIEGKDISSPPDNNPHQGCEFRVEFYNYDKGDDYFATVTFADQAPTADGGVTVVSGDTHPFIGGDDAGGGNDLDASVLYTLKFTGEPHPQQGYHIKITVEAPGSIGAKAKHKVFWVEGCTTTPPTTPPTSPPTTQPTSTDTPPTTAPTTPPTTRDTPPTTPPTTTDTPPTTPPTTTDTPPVSPSETPSTTPSSPGTSTSPSDTPPTVTESTPASDVPSDTPTVGVPTEVDAGFGGPASNSVAGGNSPFGLAGGLLLAAGGAMLAGAGIVALRRRGTHSA